MQVNVIKVGNSVADNSVVSTLVTVLNSLVGDLPRKGDTLNITKADGNIGGLIVRNVVWNFTDGDLVSVEIIV